MECVCGDNVVEDGPDFASTATRKARKQHECCECPDPIMPGDEYEYVSGMWDGMFMVFRTCKTCAAVRSGQMQSWHYGELRADLLECLGLDYITGEFAYWTDEATQEQEKN